MAIHLIVLYATGCIGNKWGKHCQDPCPAPCTGNCNESCHADTGNCYFCADQYTWGGRCQHKCPDECIMYWPNNAAGNCGLVCNISNGNCLLCDDGWYGTQCQHKCKNCTTCDRITGRCPAAQVEHFDMMLLLPIITLSCLGFCILWKVILGCCGYSTSFTGFGRGYGTTDVLVVDREGNTVYGTLIN